MAKLPEQQFGEFAGALVSIVHRACHDQQRTWIAIEVCEAGRLAAHGEPCAIKRPLQRLWTYRDVSTVSGIRWKALHVGPRSTAQLATGHPTLFVIAIGRSYPSTRDTVRMFRKVRGRGTIQRTIVEVLISGPLERPFCDCRRWHAL